jgi:hypothetical protein
LRKLVSLVVAMLALTAVTAGVASASTPTVTYTGQGMNATGPITSKCDAPDNGGTGAALVAGQNYLLWVLTLNASPTGGVTIHLPDGEHQMVQVGGTWKYVSSFFSRDSLVVFPAHATFAGSSARVQLTVSHGCARAPSHTATVIHKAGGHDPILGSQPLGTSVHDSATVTVDGGVAIPPTSTVKFDWYTTSDCSGAVIDSATKDAAASVDDALPKGPLHAGGYGYKATFTSGNTNLVGNSTGDCEPLTIDKAQLAVTTTIHNASDEPITEASLGSVVHDTATVTGDVTGFPTGAVSFTLNGAAVGNVDPPADGSATARSVNSDPLAAGDYEYAAHVDGNDDYFGADSAKEPLTINKAQLSISTLIHNAAHNVVTSVPADSVVHDTAQVDGKVLDFALPAVSFTLNGIPVGSADGNVDDIRSEDSAPLAAGSYTYKASVASNSNYIGADSADEPLTVTAKQQFFCSPGFWKNASDAAWALTGHSRTDLFNATVVPSFYATPSPANPTLETVLNTPGANTFGAASDPFGLNAFNAVGAYLTNAAGFFNSGSTVDNCPISNGGVITTP